MSGEYTAKIDADLMERVEAFEPLDGVKLRTPDKLRHLLHLALELVEAPTESDASNE